MFWRHLLTSQQIAAFVSGLFVMFIILLALGYAPSPA